MFALLLASQWSVSILHFSPTRDIAMNLLHQVLALVFITVFSNIAVSQEDWSLRKDRGGVQVYTSSVEGSPYKAVKSVERVTDTRLSLIAALI